MLSLTGYDITGRLHRSDTTTVYRAIRQQDKLPVVLKVLSTEYPSPRELTRYRNEYDILASLDLSGVIRAFALEDYRNSLYLVLEDIEAESLEVLRQRRQLEVVEVLRVAVAVATSLEGLHARNIIHKDICPANIVFNNKDERTCLIDFGLSSVLSREHPVAYSTGFIEGTLAYISPEQTGRVNRAVDCRTDLYSLGATLYELLSGRPPFVADEALELIHCHIARPPEPLNNVAPHVPLQVCNIVEKLLTKNAEERYQSARGVLLDLKACLTQLQVSGTIEPFNVAQHDFSERFQIPETLYGRQAELERLVDRYDKAAGGNRHLVLVSGFSGIGKSALVREFQAAIAKRSGCFVTGKFDRLHRNVPYSALRGALQQLMRRIFAESEEGIQHWREVIVNALGNTVSVMADLVPWIEQLVGEQSPIPELPATEAQNRFNLAFTNLITVLATADTPIVIFLDDLQWADLASLQLIELVMHASDAKHLLLVGAYRENEVHLTHPLVNTIERIDDETGMVTELRLGPLTPESVTALMAETLRRTHSDLEPFAKLVFNRTEGNPFFVRELLKFLYIDGLITFNHETGNWTWDLDRITSRGVTDNIAVLMVGKIRRLELQSQRALMVAACLGTEFSAKSLAFALESTARDALSDLKPAIDNGIVLPVGQAYRSVELGMESHSGVGPAKFRFAHDRIQEAAYSLLTPHEREKVHHRVGFSLLSQTPEEQNDERFFDIVDQLNAAIDCVTDHKERIQLAELNLGAGDRARASAAHAPAFRYLKTALELLGPTAWKENYTLALSIHVSAAEAAYLSSEYDQMERMFRTVVKNARTVDDQIAVYETRVLSLKRQNRLVEAIDAGLRILRLLGVSLPAEPSRFSVAYGMVRLRLYFLRHSVESLEKLKEMTSPRLLATMRLLTSIASAAYVARPNLVPALSSMRVRLPIEHGNSPQSANSYATFGSILCALGHVDEGHKFGKLALRIAETFGTKDRDAGLLFRVGAFIDPWKHHARDSIPMLTRAYEAGLENGDFELAANAAFAATGYMWFTGTPLDEINAKAAALADRLRHLRVEASRRWIKLTEQAVRNLRGLGGTPWKIQGVAYSAQHDLPQQLAMNDTMGIHHYYATKTFLCYLFGQHDEAKNSMERARATVGGTLGLFTVSTFRFYECLVMLSQLPNLHRGKRRHALRVIRRNLRSISKWSKDAPENYAHRRDLVAAELARINNNKWEATRLYDRAVVNARKHGFIHEQGIASELAARFFIEQNNSALAQTCLSEARYCFSRWGAHAKVEQLNQIFPEHLISGTSPDSVAVTPQVGPSASHAEKSLDFVSVIKAAQSISSEIVWEKLLHRLMDIVVESAGAETACLVLDQDGRRIVSAVALLSSSEEFDFSVTPLEESDKLPRSLVQYVFRTRETVVSDNLSADSSYAEDDYVKKNLPKSALCMSIARHGVLYLENNQTTHAFHADRIELLRLLAAQATISLGNAKLYAQLAESSRLLEQRNTDLTLALARAEKSIRLRGDFLATTSHELRTPLNAIINIPESLINDFTYQDLVSCVQCKRLFERDGNDVVTPDTTCPECTTVGTLELQQRRVFSGNAEEAVRLLRSVERSARHLLVVVNDILDMGQLEAGEAALKVEQVVAAEVATEVAEALAPLARQKRIELSVEVDKQIVLTADRVKFTQILINLVGNAIKFSPQEGSVGIRGEKRGRDLLCWVEDQGCGIAPHEQALVFESFRQLDGGQSRQHGGTGLGLAIVKRLVELHDGKVWVESRIGKGSTFFVLMPMDGPC